MQDNKDKIREKNIDNISKHIAGTNRKNKIKKIDKTNSHLEGLQEYQQLFTIYLNYLLELLCFS